MELKSDLLCKGNVWYKIGQGYGYTEKPKFFNTFWGVFKTCLAIGILYDTQLEEEDDTEEKMTLPRTMFNRNSAEVQFFFQTAILTSNCINLSEKDRLYLAFSEDIPAEEMEDDGFETLKEGISVEALNFDKITFLKKFANYGAKKMLENLSENDSETMENIAQFLVDSFDGKTEELRRMEEVEELIDDIY